MLKILSLIGLFALGMTTSSIGRADEAAPEMRKKMAEAHQKMADCLKSTKPIAECKKAMMNDCPMMKNGHCEMMDDMGSMDHNKKSG